MKLHTPEPFWLVKNGIINSYPSLSQDTQCDVLVVGSGITGALIAHQCVKDGFNTVVIDKREVANGSSSATTSMLQYEIDTKLFELIEMIGEEGAVKSYRACSEAIDKLEEICNEIASESGFKRKESLYFAAGRKHLKDLQKEFEARKQHNFPVEWLEAETIEQKYGLKETYGGILSRQGASVDAFFLVHELLEFNRKKGLRIFDKTAISKFNYKDNGVSIVTEDGFNLNAKKIIFCTGFETVDIIKEKFVKLISTYAIVGEQQPEHLQPLAQTLFWSTAEPYEYFRTTDDGRLLIGGEDEDFSNPEKRDKLISRKTKILEDYLEKHLPNLKFRTDFAWAGTFGTTNDGLPFIGEHKDFKNAYFVLGFGGNGITFSVTGMEMVSEFLQGKKHELEEWFRFGR